MLELCPNGSLADMLKKRKHLTLPEIRRFVVQICGAVKYLHHRHIVHRDLKTGNLFLDGNMNVKVGDFGLAALLVTEREMEVKRRTTMCGTPNYLAPEILEKGKGHDEKVDLWAIGVIAYTLAVGKAPFHASTKEEIYKKLKSGTYTWPELSATNHQSADLRDLVASLLVPEEQRPPPDKIVSQNFFRIAYVPPSIPSSARVEAPIWTDVSIPSADTIRRGYSDTWYTICKQSGVGEYAEGKCFPLNGGRRVKSIVYDIAREAQAGQQPTMPLLKDMVYESTVSDWNKLSSSESEVASEARAVPSKGLKEMSHNEVAFMRARIADERGARDAALMPPPARPASRLNGTGTVRKAARTISEETAKSGESVKVASDGAPQAQATLRVAKTRQAPTAATTSLKETNSSSSSSAGRMAKSQNTMESDTEKPTRRAGNVLESDTEKPTRRAGTVKRSADASLARRPRAVSRKERPISPEVPGPFATLEELKHVSPIKRSRKKAADAEVFEILSDPESDEKPTAPALSLGPTPQLAKRLPVPRKVSADSNAIAGTDPETVLERLSLLRDKLAAALQHRSHPSSSAPGSSEPEPLPFVTRWVDYSRKHGVGYVLSDGTVGCIINASVAKHTPVTHVLVRNGQRWLPRVGKNFEHIDQVPLEILEDGCEEGIVRKVYKGLGSVKEGPLAAEAERRRMLSVLWVKFGRYMCQSLDGDEVKVGKNEGNFVRFYQRIGNVGIWAFADGCLQVSCSKSLYSRFLLGRHGRD